MNEEYENQSMITCIGNKRKLIPNIKDIIEKDILPLIQKDKLNIVDGFSGSSIVSRALSQYSETIYSNDIEKYSYIITYCFLVKPTSSQQNLIQKHIHTMNELVDNGPYYEGIITELYSPKDTQNPKEGERCFYTRENAIIIDTLRKYIDDSVPKELFNYCIAPLLIKASIHANTSGVFRGFHKNKNTKLGAWGGTKGDDTGRIMGKIKLDVPIWSNLKYNSRIYNNDINEVIEQLPNTIDLIYYDPPYNQHPYGSNYFMLNVIIENRMPEDISKISGIPKYWKRSNYNYEKKAFTSMKELIDKSIEKTKYILLSYNNEGIIKPDEWNKIFEPYNVTRYESLYDTFKGSRNLRERNNKVIEIMYLISKKE